MKRWNEEDDMMWTFEYYFNDGHTLDEVIQEGKTYNIIFDAWIIVWSGYKS